MSNSSSRQAALPGSRSLIGSIFSWSIRDVLNRNLYNDKVKEIPLTFRSSDQYLNSFVAPLIEETHADLSSGISSVARAPICEILLVERSKDYREDIHLQYNIKLVQGSEACGNVSSSVLSAYEPDFGDIIALTDAKPKCIDDLSKPLAPYRIALVQGSADDDNEKQLILSSRPIVCQSYMEKNRKEERLFAVFLINIKTNLRIWKALNPDPKASNLDIINTVLQADTSAGDHCSRCSIADSSVSDVSVSLNAIQSFGLNDSQQAAVLSCVAASSCCHKSSVKLIWGPPGTGKTKTIGALLFALRILKCRTLTCAPTNTAVLQVATRLYDLVKESLKDDTYGLGDIVLFGNGKRMKVKDEHENLLDVFLDHRVKLLEKCFAPLTGWKGSMESLISLLEEPEEMYHSYLEKERRVKEALETDDDSERKGSYDASKAVLTFKEFFMVRFKSLSEQIRYCTVGLYSHLPTSVLPLDVVKVMKTALLLLKSFGCWLNQDHSMSEGLKEFAQHFAAVKGLNLSDIKVARKECLQVLKSLIELFNIPTHDGGISKFCLGKALLILCTASTSASLHAEAKNPFQMLVIDEAAQLKECESAIPLQLSGLHHAVLIGDERQLPAMVKSNICEKVQFGRSLFERLVLLGHRKHLLNVQYRMDPTISLFPNIKFYDKLILDAPNVKEASYKKQYLRGAMYGSYSFINVSYGKEEFDGGHSQRNMFEAAVACEIVSRLFTESVSKNRKISVGVVSPYKAQVFAIQDMISKKYLQDLDSRFSVSVRSVDGFQGGEDDIIIISTVRCNGSGSVGFLSNFQRTNVALTRARHCLWILGNGQTLVNSDSVWSKLVMDAMDRDSFYNCEEDDILAKAISHSLCEYNRLDILLDKDSLLFKNAKWQMYFSPEFHKSMMRIASKETKMAALVLLEKLSSGCREGRRRPNCLVEGGSSSELLKLYSVGDEHLTLVWSIDVLKESSSSMLQVLKVWDIQPISEIPKLARRLDAIFDNYTVNIINRCKHRCVEGTLEVPMKWQLESNAAEELSRHAEQFLLKPFATLSLTDNSESSQRNSRGGKQRGYGRRHEKSTRSGRHW